MPLELYNRKALVMYQIPKAMLKIRPLIKYITLEEIWKSVDQTAWEKWTKAKALWEKKLKLMYEYGRDATRSSDSPRDS